MRLLLLGFVFISYFAFSQEDEKESIYFPQEQLIHPECANKEDKNACLKNIFTSRIQETLQKFINQVKLEKDTIKVNVRFDVDQKGNIAEGYHYVSVSEKSLDKKANKQLDLVLSEMPTMKILNKKLEKYNSFHLLHMAFIANKSDDSLALASIASKSKYTGGYIEEMPIFPGCEGLSNKALGQCFNKGMQQHLAKNFRYPKKAQKKKIQGKVNIMFRIDENGNVSDIKTRGPHPILEAETIRIIKLFPKCIPGKLNGKPKQTPFAVPLTFKLK